MKTIVTITGIRPDFIRMSAIFEKLDRNCKHILVHTGQHYDEMLSDVFFKELEIRKPDYNLECGKPGKEHYEQSADISVKAVQLLRSLGGPNAIDWVVFLGDSNSVCSAVALKKEGYKIAHIEAGMRSGDMRMLEEINRIVCDSCSDLLFVYHKDYLKHIKHLKARAVVTGNTIVESINRVDGRYFVRPKERDGFILDIHRPENTNHLDRMENIFEFAVGLAKRYKTKIKLLMFPKVQSLLNNNPDVIKKEDRHYFEFTPLMSFREYVLAQQNSIAVISDSGTAQEECALLDVPVLVPRDYTERPQSYTTHNSMRIPVGYKSQSCIDRAIKFIEEYDDNISRSARWLYPPQVTQLLNNTSSIIVNELLK